MTMINTSECEYCRYGTVDETDKSRIKVYCSLREKTYWYGQCIQCDSKVKVEILKEEVDTTEIKD